MVDESPPNYEDVVHQNTTSNIDPVAASAPLLQDESASCPVITSLNAAIQLPDNLNFSIGNTSQDQYGFFIRDQMQLLVAKGYVLGKSSDFIFVDTSTEETFLEIFAENRIHEFPNIIFKVNHSNFLLGSTSIHGNHLGSISVKNNFEQSIYKIVSHKFQESADIIITKNNSVTVCRIHIKAPKNTSDLSFDACVSFSSCNTIEKCLFISVTIAYIVSRNKLRRQTNTKYSSPRINNTTGTINDLRSSHNDWMTYNFSTSNTTHGTGGMNSSTATAFFNDEIQIGGNQTERRDSTDSENDKCFTCLIAIVMLAVIAGVIGGILWMAGAFDPICVRKPHLYQCTNPENYKNN